MPLQSTREPFRGEMTSSILSRVPAPSTSTLLPLDSPQAKRRLGLQQSFLPALSSIPRISVRLVRPGGASFDRCRLILNSSWKSLEQRRRGSSWRSDHWPRRGGMEVRGSRIVIKVRVRKAWWWLEESHSRPSGRDSQPAPA